MNRHLIGIVLVAIAAYGLVGDRLPAIDWPVINRPVITPAPEPSPEIKEEVLQLRGGFQAGGRKLIGLFEAIARETRANQKIRTLGQVEKFNFSAMDRYVQLSGFEPVLGLGGRVDEFVFAGIDGINDPRTELTGTIRNQLSDRYMALEWLVQQVGT